MSILTAYDKFIQQALKYGFSLWGLPKTGQTTEYRTHDDGELQKGYPRTGARFVDNGDGTITDNATGLMWVKDPKNDLPAPWPTTFTWNNAITTCKVVTFAGHIDWRLPNIIELFSLVDHSKPAGTAIIDTIFTNCEKAPHWSSTTWKSVTTWAKYVDFSNGDVGFAAKTLSYRVRPVRQGIP